MKNWKDVRKELNINNEDENIIRIEKELINTMCEIREEKGMTQKQLADLCDVKQPMIARMEKAEHSPQLDSFLKVLLPLGYTLQIVPISKK